MITDVHFVVSDRPTVEGLLPTTSAASLLSVCSTAITHVPERALAAAALPGQAADPGAGATTG